MDEVAKLRRLFAYETWANRQVLGSLQAVATPPASAVSRFAHVLQARRIWLARLHAQRDPVAPWASLTLAQCADVLAEIDGGWDTFLEKLSAATLGETIAYTNSKGQRFESHVDDVLHHVLLHSAYHRGQIASDLRAAGVSPVYTDFIHATRIHALP